MTATASQLMLKPIPSPDRPQLRLIPGGRSGPTYQQRTLDLEFAIPAVDPVIPKLIAPMRLIHSNTWTNPDSEEDDGFFERQPTGTANLPAAEPWAHRFAQMLSEVAQGTRPAGQLRKWVTPKVLATLRPQVASTKASRARSGRTTPAVVKRVRVDQPTDGVAEVAAVVRSRRRAYALALRLEGWDGRWICTQAEWV